MAISAKLQFGDNDCGQYASEYPVLGYECHFSRHYEASTPDSDPRCNRMSIVVVTPGKDNLELLQWFVNRSYMTGRIILDVSEMVESAGEDITREIKFEDARCYAIEEDYDNTVNRLRVLKLDIMAENVEIDSVKFNL